MKFLAFMYLLKDLFYCEKKTGFNDKTNLIFGIIELHVLPSF